MAGSNPRAVTRYTPGSWLGVVRAGTVVLLSPDTAASLAEPLWELLGSRPEVHEVLAAVTAASGGSLAQLPEFGIVHVGESVHVFLRGGIDLEARHAQDTQHGGPATALSGRDVTTWTERRLARPGSFRLVIADAGNNSGNSRRFAAGGDTSSDPLPLSDGVVLLQSLSVEFGDGGAAAAPAAPQDHGVSTETVLELPDDDADADAAVAMSAVEPTSEPVSPDFTSNYDHLWEQTVMRSIEDAAVREDPDEGTDKGASAPAPVAAPEAAPVAADAKRDPAPAPAEERAEQPTEGPAAPVPSAPAASAVPDVPAGSSGIIDSVPWMVGGRPRAAGVRPPSFRPDAAHSAAQDAGHPAARVTGHPAAQDAGHDAQDAGHDGQDTDHDGQTIVKEPVPAASAARQGAAPARDTAPGTGPMVLARVCAEGHANPSTYAQCGRCGLPLPGDGVQVRRPLLGHMRLSNGELIALDQSLVVGRQPSVSRVQGAVMPRLVQVASPSGDISRSHVEVRLEGWHVMLCDLKATNGTVLVREGQAPRRLAQGEMAIVLDGDIAELGDGVSLRFEEIP